MKIRRDVSSIPIRSAEATWERIVELVTGDDTVDRDQLAAGTAVIASLITDELMRDHPFVFSGVGSRLVIYLRYGPDALEAGEDVDAIAWNPTAGDWELSVPCATEDLGWARDALNEKAPRIKLRDPNEVIDEAATAKAASGPGAIVVDWSGGKK